MNQQEQNEEERTPFVYVPLTHEEADAYAEAISEMQRYRVNPLSSDVLVTFVVDVTKDPNEPMEMVKAHPCKKEVLDKVLDALALSIKMMNVPIALIATCEVAQTKQEDCPTVLLTVVSALPNYNSSIIGANKENPLESESKAIVDALIAERVEQVQRFWSIAAAMNPQYKEAVEASGGMFSAEEDEEQAGEREFVMGGGHDNMPTSFEGFSHLSDLLEYLTENDLFAEGDED